MSLFVASEKMYLKGPTISLPERVMTNSELVKWMGADFRESWIEKRTGIKERRWVDAKTAVSDLALEATEKIFSQGLSKKESITQVILASISGDYLTPPTSPLLQHRLGLKNVGCFDLGAACAGFVTGLHVAGALSLATSGDQLLIACDIRSKFLNPKDFATAVLFGDGAGACVVSRNQSQASYRFIASQLFTDGSVADIISIPAGGSRLPFHESQVPEDSYLKMKKGAELFVKAADGMALAAEEFLSQIKMKLSDISWVVPHQANLLLIREVARKLGIPEGKMVETVAHYGNTAGSSVALALETLSRNPSLKSGQKVLLIAAGGGGLGACALLERSPQSSS